MKRSAFAIGLIAVTLLAPPCASAGGWWASIRVDRTTVSVGQEATAHADVMFRTIRQAQAAASGREAFYVYLLRDFDYSLVDQAMREPSPQNWWFVGSAHAYELERVVITVTDSNLGRAAASFRVPDVVPPGKYAVMFCDAGCAHPLADVIPTHPNALMVTPSRVSGTASWVYAAVLAAGVILGALLGFLFGRQTSARPTPSEPTWQPSDEELAELIARQRRERERRTARIA